jgi:hypothetical protein
LIIKDRKNSYTLGEETVSKLQTEYKIPKQLVRYLLDDTSLWVTAADVVISIDSNLSYEAVQAETPAINLLTPFGLLVGPAFGADDPILQCEPAELGNQLYAILSSAPLRAELLEKMRHNTKYFNYGGDGKEAERLCTLLERKRRVQVLHDQDSWLTLQRPNSARIKALNDTILHSEVKPAIHVVVNAAGADQNQLQSTLDSLQSQLFQAVQITVVSAEDSWAEEVNQLLFADQSCNWAMLIPAGYIVEPQLLLTLAGACCKHPEWRLVYMNEDTLDQDGKYTEPLFKPDLNLELLLSNPYLGDVMCFRMDAYTELEGLGKLKYIENHQLALRMLASYGESCAGHCMDFCHRTGARAGNAYEIATNSQLAIRQYLQAVNADAEVRQGMSPETFHVVYREAHKPLVSVLIAVGEQVTAIKACLSEFIKMSSGSHFEIIIGVAGSVVASMEYLAEFKASHSGLPLTIIPLRCEQTLGALHNVLAEHAQGELLLFLYNDVLATSQLWLDQLSALCNRPDVVAVSPRLVSFDSRLRSKMALTDMGVDFNISLAGLTVTDPGYMKRAHSTQTLQQLSPGCLMVNATAFKEVGGFSQNADDGLCVRQLCLQLCKNGGKLLWTPNITLLSCESISASGWPGVTPVS